MRRVYYALFAAAALAVSIWLVVHYDVLTLARAFVVPAWRWLVLTGRLISGPLWQGLTVAARPLAKNYLMRRLEAPLWRILTQAALLLVGFGAIAKLSARMRSGGTYLRRGVVWWKARHRVLRWGVASGLGSAPASSVSACTSCRCGFPFPAASCRACISGGPTAS
jgi:hypothetical protein